MTEFYRATKAPILPVTPVAGVWRAPQRRKNERRTREGGMKDAPVAGRLRVPDGLRDEHWREYRQDSQIFMLCFTGALWLCILVYLVF